MKLLITTILIISSLNSCASLRNINLVSASDEIKMGEEYSSYIEKKLEMCRNEIVNSYIDSLGQSLTSNSKRSNVTYKFKVILDKSINAFAVLGGWIYVTSSLILASDSEDELASVISHEIGHIEKKHSAKAITSHTGLQIAGEAIFHKKPSIKDKILIGSTLILLKNSRESEKEADYYGVDNLARHNYYPWAFLTFLDKIENDMNKLVEWTSTHPSSKNRKKYIRRHVDALIADLPTGDNGYSIMKVKHRISKSYDNVKKILDKDL